MVENLYVHFPFCRRKCRYCALYSRVGTSPASRAAYVRQLAEAIAAWSPGPLKTVYFGGGSPALCELDPLLSALAPCLSDETEFTVEVHPLDISEARLAAWRAGGVNRLSMGVQSLDDATLAAMGRGYTADEAAGAFRRAKRVFDNVGIDLIVGYPGDPCRGWARLADWGLRHCSVYSLQNERGLSGVPDDDWTLDRVREVAASLRAQGLERYEISNYAVPGAECRHNLAVWRGEDYLGLGAGAFGRLGLWRTRHWGACPQFAGACPQGLPGSVPSSPVPSSPGSVPRGMGAGWPAPEVEVVTAEQDVLERRIFRLRTREGLDATGFPQWGQTLQAACENGLLVRENAIYRLTERGTEVCDAILAELV